MCYISNAIQITVCIPRFQCSSLLRKFLVLKHNLPFVICGIASLCYCAADGDGLWSLSASGSSSSSGGSY